MGPAHRLYLLHVLAAATISTQVMLTADCHVVLRFPKPLSLSGTKKLHSEFCGALQPHQRAAPLDANNDWSNSTPAALVHGDTVTPLRAGSTVSVSWDLSYPHNGGWKLELYSLTQELTVVDDRIFCEQNFGCVDGTATSVDFAVPSNYTCNICLLRLQRQALEWGPNITFRTCALVSISDDVDECNGCSHHGICIQGRCRCDSSLETGFWYGKYCEMQNECEADDHCGAGGVCQDTESPIPPRKQCFCREGWFGIESRTPSGISLRRCTESSSMEIGDSSKWGEEYSNMRHSTPSGNLTIYWNVDQEKGFVEFALAAKTDAWVSFAIRPEYVVGRPPPLISSYISSDKLLSPSKPPDEDKHVEEHQELPQLEDEATPPTEIDEGVDLPDPNAANWVRVEDDKPEPIIAKDIGDPSAQFPWVESESLVGIEIPVQTSMELDAILPPCGIETISAATEELQAQSCSASEKGETVYFEVQSEAYPEGEAENRTRRHLASHLKPGEADAEAAATALRESARPTGAGQEPPIFVPSSGACRSRLTPTDAPPMVNLDVTVATAVGNTFRVYDAFTTGTFRPSPDASYGGQDDILDAVGRQSVDAEGKGMVLIKLRKPLSSKDGDADYCFEEGVLYRLAYAYGQSSPGGRVFHSPPSSLETGTARNAEFYAPNALLYHGGGVDVDNHDSRGSFPGVDFFLSQAAATKCIKSYLVTPYNKGNVYRCQHELAGGISIHWSANRRTGLVRVAVRAKTVDGWVAFGFADKQFVMDGARVIMATPGNTKTYRLSGYKVPAAGWPEEAIPCLVDNSIEVTRTSAETILQFEMKNVRSGESFHALVAFSRTSGSHLDKHSAGTSQGYTWTPLVDIPDPISEDQCPARPSLSTLWAAHGVLMTAGWGVMLPIAALVAHTLRHHEPLWFHVHRAAACAGLLLATCGWAIALAKFGGLNISLAGTPGNRLTTSHAVVGMVVMILGLLQPVNAVVRPKAGSEVYAVFRRIHSAAGWVASIGGGANVVSGLLLFWHRAGRCTGIWPFILYGSWVFAFFLGWILLHFRHRKKNERAKKRKHSIYSRTDDDRHAGGESTETEWRNLDSSREYRLWLQSIHHIDMQGDPPEPSAGNNWYAGGNRVSEVMLPVLPTSTATCAQADQPVAEGTPGEHQEQRTSAPDLRDKDIGDARELRISRELTFADSSL